MEKIYLSKSKAADPDKIISAKKIAKKLYPDCEFIEYKGGKYSPTIMDPANVVVIITPSPIHKEGNIITANMGRGNFGETQYAISKGKTILFILHNKDIDLLDYKKLMIINYIQDSPEFKEYSSKNPKKNYQKSWGYIQINLTEFSPWIATQK